MKSLPCVTASLLLAAMLAGCGQTAGLTSASVRLAASQRVSQAAVAESSLPYIESIHPFIHDEWTVTSSTFKADPAHHAGLGTLTFQLKSSKGQLIKLAVVTFYNAAPRVLSNSILVGVNDEQLLDNTHIADAATILKNAAFSRPVKMELVTKALDWLQDKSFVQY